MLARRARTWMKAAAFLAVTTAAASAFAGPRSDAKADLRAKEDARIEGEAGLKAFDEQRYPDAFEHFKKADALFHAPTLVLYMARCETKLGKPLEASRLYESLLDEALKPNAPKQFKAAQGDAKAELDEATKKVAHLKVSVKDDPSAALTIDGDDVSMGDRENGKELDPGEHVVVATSANGTATQKIVLQAGASSAVVLTVTARATPVVERTKTPGSIVPAEIAFGVGAVGLVFGAVTGVVSIAKTSSIKSDCTDGHCPASDQSRADSAHTFASLSTAGFVVAGIGAASGAVLLVLRPSFGASAHVEGSVGLQGVRIRGSF